VTEYKYQFTVIIPVYNVEQYLAETLDSVIAQTIGFEENIQIVLVNDGSPDNSEKICMKYREKYPDNIIYVKKENGGVSSARNEGIPYAQGKYVNFLDSDDCWEPDAFEKVLKFFDAHYDETDVVGARKKFFDAKTGYHTLDYKFNTTKMVDLRDEYEFIQMDVTGAFIKNEAIGDTRFSTKLKYGEDACFISTIILEKCMLGVCREAVQLYRKRQDDSSALQNELKSESYYFDTPVYFHQHIFDLSMKKYGKIELFVQYMVMYDLSWRLKKKVWEYLDEDDYKRYCDLIEGLIKQMNDRVIFKQKEMFMNMKMFCLNKKYGRDVRKDLVYDHGNLLYNNLSALNLANAKTNIIWFFTEIRDGILYLEGKDNCWLARDSYEYFAQIGDEIYTPTYYHAPSFDFVNMFGVAEEGRAIKLVIPLKKGEEQKIQFIFRYGENKRLIYTSMGKFAHIPPIWGGYYAKEDFLLKMSGKCLAVHPYSKSLHRKYETFYREQLKKNNRGYLIKYRRLYSLMKKKDKQIWLISDRTDKANDNGEHMFRYINSLGLKDVDVYYYIDKNSPDFDKMKKIGKVIPYNTPQYRLYSLLADKMISSSGSEYVINAFGGDRKYLCDLYNFDYVFLQHGITKDDISEWINKFNKNMNMIVTAGKPEQKSFLEPGYSYGPDVPVLTGFPRHDNLLRLQKTNPVEKKVLIIPTWRKSIKGSYDPRTTESIYFEGFRETEYFKFYNSLINDKKLCDCMREKGYKGVLCMHPIHSEQWIDFTPNDVFDINHGYVDYQKEFTTSALLVTDYSSVFFDFAYLKKPMVYSQFDKEQFFSGEHSYTKGYFSYEDNGFGPVCYDLETTVDEMIKMIENDCSDPDEYVKRIEDFYEYFDENNCQRVYEAIRRLDEPTE